MSYLQGEPLVFPVHSGHFTDHGFVALAQVRVFHSIPPIIVETPQSSKEGEVHVEKSIAWIRDFTYFLTQTAKNCTDSRSKQSAVQKCLCYLTMSRQAKTSSI